MSSHMLVDFFFKITSLISEIGATWQIFFFLNQCFDIVFQFFVKQDEFT